MNRYVVDTHALFWYLIASPKLGKKAKQAFLEGANGDALIYVPVIVLAELFFLNEKAHRPMNFAIEYGRLANSSQFVFIPFEPQDVLDFDKDGAVPEMHDRMIAGVARRLDAICLSRDPAIQASTLLTSVWD